MAIIIGEIESLSRLKTTLSQKGIDRFNSIAEINDFTKNYPAERKTILNDVEIDLETEANMLLAQKAKVKQDYDRIRHDQINKLNHRIYRLKNKHARVNEKLTKNFLARFFKWIQLKWLQAIIFYFQYSFHSIIRQRTYVVEKCLNEIDIKLFRYTEDRENTFYRRSAPFVKQLDEIKEVIDEAYPIITGAVGEQLLEREISKLSDNYVLFNDYSIDFETPIFNKAENDQIFSIQIDHLLVTNAGIFVIETKNWSKRSIENYDLRSPVQQIKRTGHAIFKLLNTNGTQNRQILNKHHWGDKKIPVRNIVAMVNHKPKEEFNFVKIKTINEVNRYITHFDPIFSNDEVKRISDYLKNLKDL